VEAGTAELRRWRPNERPVDARPVSAASFLALGGAIAVTIGSLFASPARAASPAPDPFPVEATAPQPSTSSAARPAPDPYPSTSSAPTPTPERAPAAPTTARSSSTGISPRPTTKTKTQTPARTGKQQPTTKARATTPRQTKAKTSTSTQTTPRVIPRAEMPTRVATAPAPFAAALPEDLLVRGALALLALVLASSSLLYLVTRADGRSAKA